ncbi:MAG TPA: bifunctional glutamate N-acetyltransferase/amino-acid acetyltransferase ArgJ [Actinomycetota bacterium]|nr:bifunctional glutamate N-acetyltransferase/amino-acid acetyltransferase ArgJ [Actinomycetota bacterium]
MAVSWPGGIRSGGVACGIKQGGGADLGVIVTDRPAAWAGTFTKNAAAAASVHHCRALLGASVRAVVVNSGNANACTGEQGMKNVRVTAEAAAREIGCDPDEILVASTGPIGVQLPVERIVGALPQALGSVASDTTSFAEAIMTTDTTIKTAVEARDGFNLVGVAKGAAMLAPNMATMLAFLATDASLDHAGLQEALGGAVRTSFDRISVDACESTNDSVFLLAAGTAGPAASDAFADAVANVCKSLAEQMVRDAEGGSRFVRIRVRGARDEDDAVLMARAVAASTLWRAALHGADPNWGRVLAALGSVDRNLDLDVVDVALGSESVFQQGSPTGSLAAAAAEMAGDELIVDCRVGPADTCVEVLTTDLSPEYVTLNASGTS